VTAFFRSTGLAAGLAALALAMFAFAGVGCTGELTEIVVVVDSDMHVPLEIDAITIHVEGVGATRDVPTDLVERMSRISSPDTVLPIWLGLVKDGDGADGPITVRVTGARNDATVVIAERSEVHFQQGKTLMLRIHLLRECKDTQSACAQVCTDGECVVPWTGPPEPIGTTDADAGGDDAGGTDAGYEDAGDAGGVTDAGDAATPDAMIDAGPINPCMNTDQTCFNFDYVPSNFDPTLLHATLSSNGALNVSCLDAVFDSTTRMYSGMCVRPLESIEIMQAGGVPAVVIPLTALTIGTNGALRVVGNRPVIFAVFGDVNIIGLLDASARMNVPGAGGNVLCAPPPTTGPWMDTGTGQPGFIQSGADRGGSGGGGGAFGSVGGAGGRADVLGNPGSLPAAGMVEGDDTLVPLRGGCRGGAGGQEATNGAVFGGAGGGAIQLSVAGMLNISGTIVAGGGGGQRALLLEDGGAGGGSGGAIFVEAQSVVSTTTAWISVNGGGGGGGYGHDAMGGNPVAGANAPPRSTAGGTGGAAVNLGGRGGNGAGASTAAQAGANAQQGIPLLQFGAGGGGGGGGVGRIRVRDVARASNNCAFDGNFSPAAVVACGS